VDTYSTLAKIAGASVPQDRPIDGVDQTDFLLGKSEKSAREGFPVFVADRLEAVKWRNWKVVFYDEQRDWWTPPTRLGVPKAFDLITDPKEEYPATGLRHLERGAGHEGRGRVRGELEETPADPAWHARSLHATAVTRSTLKSGTAPATGTLCRRCCGGACTPSAGR
jgi:hypothetical protein